MASTIDVRVKIGSRTTAARVRNAIVATRRVNYTVVPLLTAVSMTQPTRLGAARRQDPPERLRLNRSGTAVALLIRGANYVGACYIRPPALCSQRSRREVAP